MQGLSPELGKLLRQTGFYPDDMDFTTLHNQFLAQMRIALYGGTASIPMRPTYLNPFGSRPLDVPVAVAEFTDTEIRTARVNFTEAGAQVVSGECFPIPGDAYPAPLSDLLYGAAELLEPLLSDCKHIALCVPFPMERTAQGEGYLVSVPEYMTVTDFQDVPLRESFLQELCGRGFSEHKVFLVNSISALQLGAMTENPDEGRFLALHWGRTVNTGCAMPHSAVLKLRSGARELLLMDCCVGGFTAVPFGGIDLTGDRDSRQPGFDLLNKMVSTDLLGKLYRFSMIRGVEHGLLTFMCGREFLSLRRLSLDAVLEFLQEPDGDHVLGNFCRHHEEDLQVALPVARAVLDRAAKLVCCAAASLMSLGGAGGRASSPAVLAVSGAAFSSPYLRKILEEAFSRFALEELGLHCRLYHNPDSVLIGGAAAALMALH